MPKYFDSDELLKKLPDDLPYKASVKRVLMQAPAADVAPLSEVEKLQNELVIWKQNRFNLYQKLECYEMARQKVGREIFEEIEKIIDKHHSECYEYEDGDECDTAITYISYISYDIDELKKKYTEEKL